MTNAWLIVAKQTYRTRLKSLTYWMLVLSPLLLAVFSICIVLLFDSASSSNDKATLAIVQQTQLTKDLKATKALNAHVKNIATENAAKRQLKDADIDGYLIQTGDSFKLVTSATGNTSINKDTLQTLLTQFKVAAMAYKLNISAAQLQSLQAPVDLKIQQINSKDGTANTDTNRGANSALSIGIGVLFFIILLFYVQIIAQEIANEKSSRIMEILLAATSAASQFYGKIIGVFSLAITQILLYIIIGAGAIAIFKDNRIFQSVRTIFSNVSLSFTLVTVIMLLLAILMYLTLAAIIASLINDQSQVQQAVQPVTYIAMIGYVLSFIVAQSPHNLLINLASYVPFISQTLVPSRLALDFIGNSQAWCAIGLQIISVALLLKFGLKIYERNVLEYSDESIYKQLARLIRGK